MRQSTSKCDSLPSGCCLKPLKVTLNTIAGDIFSMEDTATALSCR
jgi:hypothetical protein